MFKLMAWASLAFTAAPFLILAKSTPPKYIWNLGIAMACDVTPFKNGLPYDYHTVVSESVVRLKNYIKEIKEGDLIWLQSHKVANFYHNILPAINTSFILVINDGDAAFPSSYRKLFDVDALINDPRVICIFSQNADNISHKKIHGIPIGIDFHTLAHSQYCACFRESQQSTEEQERVLEQVLANLPPTHLRINKAFVDFHLSNRGVFDGESRQSIFNQIYPTGLIDAAPARMPRHLLWQIKGQYAFSISPRGIGLDCHRTWEDLVLGCIVIVKTSPLDSLYKGLPVVIIKDWSEITESNLNKWLIQYGDAFTNPSYREQLTHAYWMNIINSYKPVNKMNPPNGGYACSKSPAPSF